MTELIASAGAAQALLSIRARKRGVIRKAIYAVQGATAIFCAAKITADVKAQKPLGAALTAIAGAGAILLLNIAEEGLDGRDTREG